MIAKFVEDILMLERPYMHYIKKDIIPIINENDTVATEEINLVIMIDLLLEWHKYLVPIY